MKILFLGDIVGNSGQQLVLEQVPLLRNTMALDAVVVNAENVAGGFGMTADLCEELFEAGVDVITSGNHFYDQKQIADYYSWQDRLLRPLNYEDTLPGKGKVRYTLLTGQTLIVLNVMGSLFMPPVNDPFDALDKALEEEVLGKEGVAAILVDVHAEATSEKKILAHYLDGRVSGVFGTHTHVPTADAHILSKGTAFQTDAGMCGDYNSVIGMNADISLARFRRQKAASRLEPGNGPASLGGVLLETDPDTGLALHVHSFRQGPFIDSVFIKDSL